MRVFTNNPSCITLVTYSVRDVGFQLEVFTRGIKLFLFLFLFLDSI